MQNRRTQSFKLKGFLNANPKVKVPDKYPVLLQVRDEISGDLSISITSKGGNIDSQDIPKFKNPYEANNWTICKKHFGTAIGIFLINNIIEKMGGTFEILSKEGKDSTEYRLQIPVTIPQEEKLGPPTPGYNRCKILMFSENTATQEFFENLLKSYNFEIQFASDSDEFTSLIKENTNFKLVILDISISTGVRQPLAILKDLTTDQNVQNPQIMLLVKDIIETNRVRNLFPEVDFFLSKAARTEAIKIKIESVLVKPSLSMHEGLRRLSTTENLTFLQHLKNTQIVIVDDEQYNLLFMEELVQNLGFKNIVPLTNGKEALDYCIEEYTKIGVLLIDNQMPVMYGMEVIEEIRNFEAIKESSGVLPIVMISGEPPGVYKQIALETGANEYLVKPIKLKQLKAALIKCQIR